MRKYHAHVYFDLSDAELAKQFQTKAQAKVGSLFQDISWYEKAVGPHDKPMVEIHFDENRDAESRLWLKQYHAPFSVLIHEDTNDDVRDHSENIEWLGKVLPIHFDFFELIKKHPELKVHP